MQGSRPARDPRRQGRRHRWGSDVRRSTGTTSSLLQTRARSSRAGRRRGRRRDRDQRAAPSTDRLRGRRRRHRCSPTSRSRTTRSSVSSSSTASRRSPARPLILFDTPTAQQVLNLEGKFTDITSRSGDGVSETQLRDRIRPVLPAEDPRPSPARQSPTNRPSDVKDGARLLQHFLLIFALIALFVGAFIIFNTFSMLVAQRTRELALMRAARGEPRPGPTGRPARGARRRSARARLIGLVARCAAWRSDSRRCSALIGAELPDGPTIIADPHGDRASLAVGTRDRRRGLHARPPGHAGSPRWPRCATTWRRRTGRSAPDDHRQPGAGWSALAAMTSGLRDGGLQVLGLGTLARFIGVAMLSPLVSKPVVVGVGRLFPGRRLPGRLGRENAVRNPRRTAATAVALMIGLALISAGRRCSARSLKASVAKTRRRGITADFILNTTVPAFPDAVVGRGRRSGRRPQHGTSVKVDGRRALRQRQLLCGQGRLRHGLPAQDHRRPGQHHHGGRLDDLGPTPS